MENKPLYCPFSDTYDAVDKVIAKYAIHMQLHAMRKRARLTQEELSVLSGLSIGTISRIETGGESTIGSIIKYANACGCEFIIKRKVDHEQR